MLRFDRLISGALAATPDDDELKPRPLSLAPAAKEVWKAYADYCETHLAKDGPYEPIRGFANKLPEHALRIAGVLTFADDLGANRISADALDRGVELAEHYASEALRLFDAGNASPEIVAAQRLLDWLKGQADEFISVRLISQFGPNSIREAAAARAAIKTVADHNWLFRETEPRKVRGKRTSETWRVVREVVE